MLRDRLKHSITFRPATGWLRTVTSHFSTPHRCFDRPDHDAACQRESRARCGRSGCAIPRRPAVVQDPAARRAACAPCCPLLSPDVLTRLLAAYSPATDATGASTSPPLTLLDAHDMTMFGATPLEVADGQHVVRCPDCTKPVLESALAAHHRQCTPQALVAHTALRASAHAFSPRTVNCLKIRERKPNGVHPLADPKSASLKRGLSDAGTGAPDPATPSRSHAHLTCALAQPQTRHRRPRSQNRRSSSRSATRASSPAARATRPTRPSRRRKRTRTRATGRRRPHRAARWLHRAARPRRTSRPRADVSPPWPVVELQRTADPATWRLPQPARLTSRSSAA